MVEPGAGPNWHIGVHVSLLSVVLGVSQPVALPCLPFEHDFSRRVAQSFIVRSDGHAGPRPPTPRRGD